MQSCSYNSRYSWKNQTDNSYNNMSQPMDNGYNNVQPMDNGYNNMSPMSNGYNNMFQPMESEDQSMNAPRPDHMRMSEPQDVTEMAPMIQNYIMPSMVPQNIPESLICPIYTAGYLSTQVGKLMRVELLAGNTMTDRVGRLVEVGASYIILQSMDPASMILCDLSSVKFVTFMDREVPGAYAHSK